ncbi:uncharacterized protein LOC106666042 isoform X2 [Cimex lectularius]|uniref:O-acyltransferase WSD1 C-terminal domain-containing protein n=1 Tax=Cimex lectularius TaxID=79782 RepID=A0A8I6RNW8_CIMLE|nr:uncharacterized protein LOC106666042 isoform X2 [Cimex lectularius]
MDFSNCTNENELLNNVQNNPPFISVLYLFSICVTGVHLKNNDFKVSSFVREATRSLIVLFLAVQIAAVLTALYIYRKCVELILKRREKYRGLVTGPDAYWALENVNSRSIINILMTIELSKAIEERLLKFGPEKLTYCAKWSEFGYSYWLKNVTDLNRQIRKDDLSSLETALSDLANEPLPDDSLWEIIIGEKSVYKNCYYVIFRVHHCIGDGFSLMKQFLEILVDKPDSNEMKNIETNRSFVEQKTSMFHKLTALYYTPAVLGKQIFSKPDINAFHNKTLIGKKFIFWKIYELKRLKEIKNSLGCSFTTMLLYSIAKGLQHNLNTDEVTLVIPAKISQGQSPSEGFTLALLKIPLKGRFQKMFSTISKNTQTLKTLPDFLVNYWLLKVGFSLLPLGLIGNALKSNHATFIFSNIPGPGQASIFGNVVQDIKFWLPHRDKTGIGFSVLSYGDKVNIGISADQACIPNSYQVEALMDRIVANLDELHINVK